MLESSFQARLIKEIKKRFEGCVVVKNDPNYLQGFPDLTIFFNDRYALLECKRSRDEPHQPNQDFYVRKMNGMSYAAFIFPENKEEILNELQTALRSEK